MTNQQILDFQYVLEVEGGDLLRQLQAQSRRRALAVTPFYRELVDQILRELQAGSMAPADIPAYVQQQLINAVADNTLEASIMQAVDTDLQRIARVIESGFDILGRPYGLDEARVIARNNVSRYALDNGVKIGNRMAFQLNSLAREYEGEELIELARAQVGTATSRLRTVMQDIHHSYDRELMFVSAERTGLTHFRYRKVINPNTRWFCKELVRLGYCYTLPQIRNLRNGHGLNVQAFCGGYNCIHSWIAGEPGWPGFSKPYPAGAPFQQIISPEDSKRIRIPL